MKQKAVIIVLAVGAASILLFTLFLFFTPEPPAIPVFRPTPSGGVKVPGAGLVREQDGTAEKTPIEPPAGEKKEQKIAFFGTSIEIPARFFEELRPLLSFAERFPAARPPEPATLRPVPTAVEPALTVEQVYRLLYPNFYLEILRKAQDKLAARNVIASGEKFSFKDEGEVKKFNDILIADLLKRKKISEEEHQAYLKGRAFLFDRPYEEKYKEAVDLMNYLGTPRSAEDSANLIAAKTSSCSGKRQQFISSLSKPAAFLLRILPVVPNQARAAGCFKSGAGGAEGGGANFMATCCEGCEEDGIACLSTCPGAAIWDPTTLICGCNY